MLENRLDEFQSDIVNSEREADIAALAEEGLLKAYVNSSIDKIIVSRIGDVEIIEKY